jgi:hypothetical protein
MVVSVGVMSSSQHSAWVGQAGWLRVGYAAACSHARASTAMPQAGLCRLQRWLTWRPPRLSFDLPHEAPAAFHCLSRLYGWPGNSEDETSPCPAPLLVGTDETAQIWSLPASCTPFLDTPCTKPPPFFPPQSPVWTSPTNCSHQSVAREAS